MHDSGKPHSQRGNVKSSSSAQMRERTKRARSIRHYAKVTVLLIFAIIGLAHLFQTGNQHEATNTHRASSLGSVSDSIEISQGALQHIINRHTVGGAENAGKSTFNSGEDIQALIRNAERITPVQQENGKLQRVVDAGRTIGLDRNTSQSTNIYTVITTQAGELVTAFPGMP